MQTHGGPQLRIASHQSQCKKHTSQLCRVCFKTNIPSHQNKIRLLGQNIDSYFGSLTTPRDSDLSHWWSRPRPRMFSSELSLWSSIFGVKSKSSNDSLFIIYFIIWARIIMARFATEVLYP
ncbi:hypothetical protein BT63DRAFT_102212 [Microthyrium microscopicum]|uniref:Uncharacterized protein n=1 Tax=Microthyrium microscopicum TaxID=703497 RepID=A0A6A6TVN2_9PEZI|nr:hypothetical protein BT63DRAFT_102212 [Microthyrium microscopicum]